MFVCCYICTAPEGLAPPVLVVINDMTLRVVWQPPTSPNGQVTGYYIYLDGEEIDTGMTTPGSYLLTDLQPYTIYTIQVSVMDVLHVRCLCFVVVHFKSVLSDSYSFDYICCNASGLFLDKSL